MAPYGAIFIADIYGLARTNKYKVQIVWYYFTYDR